MQFSRIDGKLTYIGPLAPGLMKLMPRTPEWEAYLDACEAAVIDSIVRSLVSMPGNTDRQEYFDYSHEVASQIENEARRDQRYAFLRRLKRLVWRAMHASSEAAA